MARPPVARWASTHVSLRLDAVTRTAVAEAAAELGLSSAEFVRGAIARALGTPMELAGFAAGKRAAYGAAVRRIAEALQDLEAP